MTVSNNARPLREGEGCCTNLTAEKCHWTHGELDLHVDLLHNVWVPVWHLNAAGRSMPLEQMMSSCSTVKNRTHAGQPTGFNGRWQNESRTQLWGLTQILGLLMVDVCSNNHISWCSLGTKASCRFAYFCLVSCFKCPDNSVQSQPPPTPSGNHISQTVNSHTM